MQAVKGAFAGEKSSRINCRSERSVKVGYRVLFEMENRCRHKDAGKTPTVKSRLVKDIGKSLG